MQTQCPQCDTKFRVTEVQLNLADGYVRCSVCQEVFNAGAINASKTDNALNFTALSDDQAESAEMPYQAAAIETSTTPSPDLDDNLVPPPAITDAEAVAFKRTASNHEAPKDGFDFFDDVANEPLSHVVPEKYKDSYKSNNGNLISNLLWSIGSLLLCFSLLAQYAWFNRDQLNQMPQLQVWAEKLCQRIDCKEIRMRNPAKIELVSRNVYSHPNKENALMIDITMKNQAAFTQPFPVMQIDFSDVRGGQITARRFLPREYLPAEIWQADVSKQLFEAGTHISFSMEIQDPGKQALTYEFDFL